MLDHSTIKLFDFQTKKIYQHENFIIIVIKIYEYITTMMKSGRLCSSFTSHNLIYLIYLTNHLPHLPNLPHLPHDIIYLNHPLYIEIHDNHIVLPGPLNISQYMKI